MESDVHRTRLERSYSRWSKHRAFLERYRVCPGDRRTTAPPAYDIAQLFPELADLVRTTVRLHPRMGDEPPVGASKLGGTFLWPAQEPWPHCRFHGIPFVTVLQLSAAEFPEIPFPHGTDLFQMLWCPRDHFGIPECEDKPCPMSWADPRFYWRNRGKIQRQLPDNPSLHEPYYEYVPFPCRLHPERVIEYPYVGDLPDDLQARLDDWASQYRNEQGKYAPLYSWELSVATGTKVGGYYNQIQSPWCPTCECGEIMEHLLTIASVEWDGMVNRRWTPIEDQAILASTSETSDDWLRLWAPTGISLGDAGHMQLFVCLCCNERPIVASIECC